MTAEPTISQILSDPRSADRAALDYCNDEMLNCLAEVDVLQAEVAALRAFVAARDAINLHDNEAYPEVTYDRMRLLEAEAEIRIRLAERYGVQLP